MLNNLYFNAFIRELIDIPSTYILENLFVGKYKALEIFRFVRICEVSIYFVARPQPFTAFPTLILNV